MNLISREELHRKLERGDDFTLVMTLSGFAYSTKHIAGSHHFETVEEALVELDREDEIVVYCADVHCVASIYACGATQVESPSGRRPATRSRVTRAPSHDPERVQRRTGRG
jgi:hypothetical protein